MSSEFTEQKEAIKDATRTKHAESRSSKTQGWWRQLGNSGFAMAMTVLFTLVPALRMGQVLPEGQTGLRQPRHSGADAEKWGVGEQALLGLAGSP